MQVVPILDTPSQVLNVTLNGQYTTINLQTRQMGMYMDLYVNNALIIGGVICQNLNPIVRDTYLGFIGDLLFLDQQGTSDPSSPGLGTRYVLLYAAPTDIALAV
jgi:hypothetical protein